ncbi:zinc transporter ZIP3-like [Branchiostoma floridae]|uniref:Zinc transporter ZIP3 n=1 Tax=Branchiostoma floridae TaxID=7739 RepID=A0A9J7L7K7_BRAFL|nr:zinc transporter ZIP3-like [Branchiostoma floridae]
MDLITVQVLTLLGLLVSCLGFSLVPLLLAWKASRPSAISNRLSRFRFLGKVNSFVGGVLFATVFLHLVPEMREDLEASMRAHGFVTDYPMAELVTCVGFFIVQVVETLTSLCSPRGQSPSQDVGRDRQTDGTVGGEDTTSPSEPIQMDNRTTENPSAQGTGSEDTYSRLVESSDNAPSPGGRCVLHTLVLLIALSVHATLEGIALGVQTVQSSLLWLFFVVVVHKSILALSLGMNVATGNLSLPYKVVTCVVFSVSGPVGQGIGLLVTDADGGGLVTSILQGLAAGTLLNVTFMEVLSKELKKSDKLGILCAIIGFALLAGLTALPEGK